MATTTNFGWETPDDTDLVKDGALAMRTLGNSIDTSLVDLKGGTTGQVLSKTTNTDMDFTWVTTDDANAIQNAIVDAKGDLIAATANDTPARLAVGNNGETLVADSSTTTGLRWQGAYAAGRNFLINGDQAIAQRGTSATGVTTSTYVTDRFNFNLTTMGTWTVTQESDAPAGFSKSLKALVTTADAAPAASDRVRIMYKNEGTAVQSLAYGSASAKTVTFSFWVKSNVTGTYVLELLNVGSSNRHIAATYSISSSGTWEKKTITFAGDTVTAIIADSEERVTGVWYLGAGSDFTSGTLATSWANLVSANRAVGQTNVAAATNNYFQITGVQMEIGSVATPFTTATGTLAGELAACQRYYWRTNGAAAFSVHGVGMALSTTDAYVVVPFPVNMRVAPTTVDYANLRILDQTVSAYTPSSIVNSSNSASQGYVLASATGMTAARTLFLQNSNNTAGYIGFSAEL